MIKVHSLTAKVECSGCAQTISADVDLARYVIPGWDLHDVAVDAAKKRGVKFGADFILKPEDMPEVWRLVKEERMTINQLIQAELESADVFYADLIEAMPINVEQLVHRVIKRYEEDREIDSLKVKERSG